jgi:pimeloyl-ACP methyl ester carboxylesterase
LILLLLIAVLFGGGLMYAPDKDRPELERTYAAAPSQFVPVAGLRVHVRDRGPLNNSGQAKSAAKTILLLHGFGASLHTWDAWAKELERTYRVIRLDLPGAGLTGADPTADYSDARGVQIIGALMDQLGVAQAVVVGHSMGGRLAWRLAADEPRRVSQLVLIAPDGFANPEFEISSPPKAGPAVRLMQFALPKALVRASLARAYADPNQLSEQTLDRYHDLLLAPQVRTALIDRLEQLAPQDPRPWLARITAPTLLMWGEKDNFIPSSQAKDYLLAIANSKLLTLPQVGHLPHEEAPAASLPALLSFLAN